MSLTSDLQKERANLRRSHFWLRCDSLLSLESQKIYLVKSLSQPRYVDPAFTWCNTKEGLNFWQSYCNGKASANDTDLAKSRLTNMISVINYALYKLYGVNEEVDDSKNIIEF